MKNIIFVLLLVPLFCSCATRRNRAADIYGAGIATVAVAGAYPEYAPYAFSAYRYMNNPTPETFIREAVTVAPLVFRKTRRYYYILPVVNQLLVINRY